MGRLDGKVAIITGGASGIGRAGCKHFAEEGAKVAVFDILKEQAEEVAHDIAQAGGVAEAFATDITEPDSVQASVAAAKKAFGMINVAYNNAGGSTPRDSTVVDVPLDEFWRAIKLDLFGTVLTCRFAIPEIIAAGGGAVVNTTSNMAFMGVAGRDGYTAAKGGVAAITRSLAAAYASQKVRVNALCPSMTRTDRAMRQLGVIAETDAIAKSGLLGIGEPIDVARAAAFLASDDSRMTTGAFLMVDSGTTAI